MTYPPGSFGAGTYGSGLYGGGEPLRPQTRIFIAFDRDTTGGILAYEDTLTGPSLGGWTAGANTTVDLNDARSRAVTGRYSAALTATADGDISATLLTESGTIEAGRSYLAWLSVISEVARTATAAAQWTSATSVGLATHSGSRTTRSTGPTRIGVLGRATAGSSRVRLTVTIAGCLAGETHWIGGVSGDDVGTEVTDDVESWQATMCGRDYELDETTAGTAKITLTDQYGWYTADRLMSPAPYLGNITPGRRVRILDDWAGALRPVWAGKTRKWTEAVPAGMASAAIATVDCDDGFRAATKATVRPPYTADLLSRVPTSLWPLTDQSGTQVVTDLSTWSPSDTPAPARLLVSKHGNAGTSYGAATVLPELATGRNCDGGSTSLGFNQDDGDIALRGGVLDLRFAPGQGPSIDFGGWCVEFWLTLDAPPASVPQVVFHQATEFSDTNPSTGFQLFVAATTGTLTAKTAAPETIATTTANVCDGHGHHVALRWQPGGTHGTADLVVDGELVGSLALTADPLPWGSPTLCWLGGVMDTFLVEPSFLFRGRGSHLTFRFFGAPTDDELAARYALGAVGAAGETECERIAAILALAGWPIQDTAVDAGVTQLLPRDWAKGNILALAQTLAGYGGAAVVADARGALAVRDRHRYVNRAEVSAWFTGSENTDPAPDDYTPWVDDSHLENVIQVEQIGGGTVTVRDRDSIARHDGEYEGDTIPLGAQTDTESVTHARWRLSRTAEPMARVDAVTWEPDGISGQWDQLVDRAFGDRIVLSGLPDVEPYDVVSEVYADDYGDYGPEIDNLIGRITHTYTGGESAMRTLTAQLEPAQIDEIGVCDDDRYGLADDDRDRCIAGY